MKNDTEKEKTCKNCKHYRSHYVFISSRFYPIDGHCVNKTLNNQNKRNRFKLHENCEYWEADDSLKTERRKSIEEALRDIEKHLFFIKEYLENDK